jgi:type IV fimbrial biogenesis protein FimT
MLGEMTSPNTLLQSLQLWLRQRGVGLVEVMVALLVLGILAATAIPSMLDVMQRKKVIATANEIVSMVGYARSEALTGQAGIDISFDDGAASHGVSCVQVATTPAVSKPKCYCWNDLATNCDTVGGSGGRMLRILSVPISSGVVFEAAPIAWKTVKGRFSIQWPRLETTLPEPAKITVSGSRGFKLKVVINEAGLASICAVGDDTAGYSACGA